MNDDEYLQFLTNAMRNAQAQVRAHSMVSKVMKMALKDRKELIAIRNAAKLKAEKDLEMLERCAEMPAGEHDVLSESQADIMMQNRGVWLSLSPNEWKPIVKLHQPTDRSDF